jgi:hypothetical protein
MSTYHPNDALAAVIVRAWSDDKFKNRLLSHPTLTNQANTIAALEEMGIYLDEPVVLELKDHAAFAPSGKQVVFVLPAPKGKPSMDTARIAMAVTVDGI